MKAAPGKIYFENLDCMRFIACTMVIAQHTQIDEVITRAFNISFIEKLAHLIASGELGVSFFFVLSGFLITYLIIFEINKTGNLNVWQFYLRRVLRIWPLYFLVIALGFLVLPALKAYLTHHPVHLDNNPIYYIAFLSNFDLLRLKDIGTGAGSLLALVVNWSIAVEEQFYIFWPLVFVVFKKTTYQISFFILIVLISIFFRFYYANNVDILRFHTLSVMGDLAIGGLAGSLSINYEKFVQIFKQMSKKAILVIYIIGFALLLYYDDLFVYLVGFNRLFVALFFAFIILEQNLSVSSIIKLKRFKTLSNFGKVTYGMYLLHPIVIFLILGVFKFIHLDGKSSIGVSLLFVITLVLTIIVSSISYKYFETRFLKLKEKFFTPAAASIKQQSVN